MIALLLATRNAGKLAELRSLLMREALQLTSLAAHPEVGEIEEKGSTFEDNAACKAIHASRRSGYWALGEDSGLVVPALRGDPGVRSARYAGVHGDDRANNEKLLRALATLRDPNARRAHFVCSVALANPRGRVVARARGVCQGRIAFEPRGEKGFGYDPCFELEDEPLTVAELTPEQKALVSHRAHAIRTLLPALRAKLRVPAPPAARPNVPPLR